MNYRYTIQQTPAPPPEPALEIVVELRHLHDGSLALYAGGHFIIEVLSTAGRVVPNAVHGTHQERFNTLLAQMTNAPR